MTSVTISTTTLAAAISPKILDSFNYYFRLLKENGAVQQIFTKYANPTCTTGVDHTLNSIS